MSTILENSVEVDPIKIKGIQEWPTPTKKKDLQQFLGFCNFYRRFVEDYSLVAKPLTKLTGNVPWKWENEQEQAFNGLKLLLTTAPVLRMPNDFRKFQVEADASDGAVSAVLSLEHDEKCTQWPISPKPYQQQKEIMRFTTKNFSQS